LAAPEVEFQSDDEALEQDLLLIAESRGITVEEARQRHALAAQVDLVADEVMRKSPESFLATRLPDDPSDTAHLLIKGSASADVVDAVRRSGTPITIESGHIFNRTDLDETQAAVHKVLLEHGLKDIVSRYNWNASAPMIEVSVSPAGVPAKAVGNGALVAAEAEAEGRAYAALSSLRLPPGLVRVDFTEAQQARVRSSSFGGMRLRRGTTGVCTSGFSVINSAGVTGVTGAGHCSGVSGIVHGTAVHATTYVTGHQGSWGDVEWYTTGQTEPDDFYADAATIRDVTAVERATNISIDEDVCGYGRTSDRRYCTTVYDLSESCTDPDVGATASRLVVVRANGLTLGDSGGPWFTGTVAFGTYYGTCAGRDAFSVADYFDEALGGGVRVRT